MPVKFDFTVFGRKKKKEILSCNYIKYWNFVGILNYSPLISYHKNCYVKINASRILLLDDEIKQIPNINITTSHNASAIYIYILVRFLQMTWQVSLPSWWCLRTVLPWGLDAWSHFQRWSCVLLQCRGAHERYIYINIYSS